ncbi:YtxH domain-containing protein [Thermomonospora umbrina]|uniref:YtxH-like protein n=1 Tax=Thermomonospora umbrina TaxID=111806 RepID=A0A3D9SUU5_9ACTN|nr:YtxH domain-containing protein [Thermomonospora umbrina]REE99367.1 hypothetical protein DFJ69_4877 [Thermomonospora umbrina]
MKIRIPFVAGAAIGYVLGTKAGRERYEQIVEQSRRFADNPKVQETAGTLRAKSEEIAETAKDRWSAKAGGAKQRMGGGHHDEPEVERLPGGRTQTERAFAQSRSGSGSGPRPGPGTGTPP